jgi:alpha/beta superfamily hydrolase
MTSIDAVRVSIGAGRLEAIAEEPRRAAQPGTTQARYAVICHPHPLYGGTMDNKVVTSLAAALHAEGIATVRFNFRGVGRSDGTYDAGNGETVDAAAVADWGAARWPGHRLVIAGFSFGAYVALRLAQIRRASNLITISPPVAMFDFSTMTVACPWLVVQGDADDVVDPQQVIDWASGLRSGAPESVEATASPQLVIMRGVGHYFHGRLQELRDTVREAVGDGSRAAEP